jgi:hypothetical protein
LLFQSCRSRIRSAMSPFSSCRARKRYTVYHIPIPSLRSPLSSPPHFITNKRHHPRLLDAEGRHRSSALSASSFQLLLQRPFSTWLALIPSTTGLFGHKSLSIVPENSLRPQPHESYPNLASIRAK